MRKNNMRRQMLKKGVTVSLALLTLIQVMGSIPTAHTYAEEEKVCRYGDLDGDEHLTVFDLYYVYILSQKGLPAIVKNQFCCIFSIS